MLSKSSLFIPILRQTKYMLCLLLATIIATVFCFQIANDSKRTRCSMSSSLKADIASGKNIVFERAFYMSRPSENDHSNHVVGVVSV